MSKLGRARRLDQNNKVVLSSVGTDSSPETRTLLISLQTVGIGSGWFHGRKQHKVLKYASC